MSKLDSKAHHSDEVRFVLKDGSWRTVDFCEPQLNLLAHAQAIELDIGSRCGGHGVCGGDRVRVTPLTDGALSPVSEAERTHLSEADLASGIRLACQCFPQPGTRFIEIRMTPEDQGTR
jgi:ferredoxin